MAANQQQESAIVVMKDGDQDLQRATSLLVRIGVRVLCSTSVTDAVNLARVARGTDSPICLVVADEAACQPGMPDLIEGLREIDSSIRILLVSEYEETDSVPSWMAAANVRAVIRKPFRRAKFLGCVLRLIGEPVVSTTS